MATVPTPSTQVAGLAVPAATVNSQGNLATYLAGRVESGGARRPLAVLRQTVAQSLTSGTPAAITLDTEDVDYDNGHSTVTSTSRYTVNTTGWYQVNFAASFASNSTGFRVAWLKKNGTTDIAPRAAILATSGTPTGVTGGALVFLFAAADYIELIAVQASGGALNTSVASPDQSYLSAEWRSV